MEKLANLDETTGLKTWLSLVVSTELIYKGVLKSKTNIIYG
jgi:hypothetical protein